MEPRPDGTSVQGARRTRRFVLWTASALLLVLVAGRLALTPLAERRGTLQRTGQVSVCVTADPFAQRVTFSGRPRSRAWTFARRAAFRAWDGLAPKRGTIDLIAEFHVREGRLRAGHPARTSEVEQVNAACTLVLQGAIRRANGTNTRRWDDVADDSGGAAHLGIDVPPAQLFELLWESLADILGTAATAAILRRAVQARGSLGAARHGGIAVRQDRPLGVKALTVRLDDCAILTPWPPVRL